MQPPQTQSQNPWQQIGYASITGAAALIRARHVPSERYAGSKGLHYYVSSVASQ